MNVQKPHMFTIYLPTLTTSSHPCFTPYNRSGQLYPPQRLMHFFTPTMLTIYLYIIVLRDTKPSKRQNNLSVTVTSKQSSITFVKKKPRKCSTYINLFLTTDDILCRRSQERQRGEAAVLVDQNLGFLKRYGQPNNRMLSVQVRFSPKRTNIKAAIFILPSERKLGEVHLFLRTKLQVSIELPK